IFQRIACEPRCPGVSRCSIAADCPYAQVFEPRWDDGPSGLADPPRAFVFRPSGMEHRQLNAGDPFFFDLHLFSSRTDLIAYFILAFRQLAVEGIGPGRTRVELLRVTTLDAEGREGAAIFENGTLAGQAAPGFAIDLAPRAAATRVLRVRFLSPTE